MGIRAPLTFCPAAQTRYAVARYLVSNKVPAERHAIRQWKNEPATRLFYMGGYVALASLIFACRWFGHPFFWGGELPVSVVSLTLVGKGVGKLARGSSVCVSIGWLTSSGFRLTDFSLGHQGLSLKNNNYDSHIRNRWFVGCLKN